MGFRLREVEAECKFSQALTGDLLRQIVAVETVENVLDQAGVQTQRERKLNLVLMVYLLISMSLFSHLSIAKVLEKLANGLRYIWPDPEYRVAGASAISDRRRQVRVAVMVELFRQVCRPLATPETLGAYLYGLRLMAIDGTVEDLADTAANSAYFGRHASDRGASAFPQMQCVYLVECGTHAIVDAGFWPCHTRERVGGLRLLRSLAPDMLVMWDRGFHDFDMVDGVRRQGAHVLSRLPSHVKPTPVQPLSDGSYLASIYPSAYQRRKRGERCRVRIITYTLTDPALPGYGETHRLLTTLLDPDRYPALDLVCAYHERWEIELVVDEIQTHQRLHDRPLRSLTPLAVLQEAYGLLIAHFVGRAFMHQAACQAGLDPDRLSFTHAIEVVRDAIREFQMTAPDQLAQLFQRLLRDMAAVRLPTRRLRSNPRVVKRKMSNFRLKRPEHLNWPQPTLPFPQAVLLI